VADFNQFGSSQPVQTGDSEHCAQCEAMLADAIDGTLSSADRVIFDRHMAACVTCSDMLADAQRGAAWLEMLKSPRPEPPATLLERILAETCHSSSATAGKQRLAHPAWQPATILGYHPAASAPSFRPEAAHPSATVLPFRSRMASQLSLRSMKQTLLQPRLAMTAAMAFFSIALTMSLTGTRVSDLRLSNLRPSTLKRNFYEANAHVLRYYDNLKVVYELESRVRDLQHSSTDDSFRLPANESAPGVQKNQQPATQNPGKQEPATAKPDSGKSHSKPGPGSSRRETPNAHVQFADLTQWQSAPFAGQSFVVFTPSLLKYLQERDMV